ncbi:MAG TPA: NAD(P)/FAD-dependent oxidoreductase [Acidimicrobiales bacterium]|nr:NAD(P)/FAD-dependent oxidoreductase [Acidimicrobiales bacterium]
MHRVVIVGAGFGGLSAARALAKKPVEVTVVDQRNFHTFQPLLYEVSTAGLDPADVAYPVRAIFGRTPNVTFRYGTVDGVDWDARTVNLEGDDPLPFDSIILATGAIAKYFGIPGAEDFTLPLYTLADARILRDHLLRRLEEIDAHPELIKDGTLTFVVIGGGPTGVEVAGALAELLDVSVRHDGFKFDRAQARIILVDGLNRLLTPFKPSASSYAADTLRRRTVELRLGRMVKAVTPTYVELDDGSRIPTRTVVWAGGVTVDGTVASGVGALADRSGRLVVRADLALPDHHQAYAIGDAAAVPWGEDRPGVTCPQLAQVAIQSGRHAAEQIVLRVKGKPTLPFHYNDKGTMATIGRRAAIAQFPSGLVIRGTLGWLSWLGLHLIYLIGFRNRITVLVNWSWRYLSWTSGPRIIVGDELPSGAVDDDHRLDQPAREPETVDAPA